VKQTGLIPDVTLPNVDIPNYFNTDSSGDEDDDRDGRRSLTMSEKKANWSVRPHKCEACGKRLDFTEVQFGHKQAWSKRGRTTRGNTVILCCRCNNMQSTHSFAWLLKALGKKKPKAGKRTKRRSSD